MQAISCSFQRCRSWIGGCRRQLISQPCKQEPTFKGVLANVSGVSAKDVSILSIAEIDAVADIQVSVASMGEMSGGARRLMASSKSGAGSSRVMLDRHLSCSLASALLMSLD